MRSHTNRSRPTFQPDALLGHGFAPHSGKWTSTIAALTALIAGLVLSGCGLGSASQSSDDELGPAASLSAVATTAAITPSNTATASFRPADEHGPGQNVPVPAKPPLADVFSKAGVEAFAGYWYEILSYGFENR